MSDIRRLLDIMARLRDPEGGCPWDLAQSFATIAPYTVEEAYEVADAIERENHADLCDELGDLLLQVVFHAQMASEAGLFDFGDVVAAISDKMERRHPHVFGEANVDTAAAQTVAWEASKAAERRERGGGVLDDVPRALPALKRAEKLGKRASGVGFDWPDAAPVRAKVDEELDELDAELQVEAPDAARVEAELGDVLFALANLSRHLGINPEAALEGSNLRFTRRFARVEANLASEGRTAAEVELDTLEAEWAAAKRAEADKER